VTRDELLAAGYDDVIVATGVTVRMPRIEGIDHPKVLSYLDVLRGGRRWASGWRSSAPAASASTPANTCCTIRSRRCRCRCKWMGEWGVDLAVRHGRRPGQARKTADAAAQLWLLQRKTTRPGAGLGKTSGWVHRATLARNGVVMMAGVQYDRIDDAGLHITVGGEQKLLEVDNVVICAGRRAWRS
jgi:2,4-dienoyl-CoA reductase (NADPH2)